MNDPEDTGKIISNLAVPVEDHLVEMQINLPGYQPVYGVLARNPDGAPPSQSFMHKESQKLLTELFIGLKRQHGNESL